MIGHDDNCIDFERTRLASGSERIAQDIDGLIRSQNRSATIRNKGTKQGATGNDGARYCMRNVGLRCAYPTYLSFVDYLREYFRQHVDRPTENSFNW
jgi:hypothetical protein